MDLADSTEVFLDRFASGVAIDTPLPKKNVASARAKEASAADLLAEGMNE